MQKIIDPQHRAGHLTSYKVKRLKYLWKQKKKIKPNIKG